VGLEHNQRLDNDVKVHAGNISASNDVTQWVHDSNELVNGAKFLAAARELGVSEEEALQLASRKRQRQTPEGAALGDAFDMDAFNAEMPAELDGVRYESEPEWAFGQDQSDFQNFTGNDYEFEAGPNGSLQRKSWADDKEPIYGSAKRTHFKENKYGQRFVAEDVVPGEIMGFTSDTAPEQRSVADMRALIAQERQRGRGTAKSDGARFSIIRAIENQLAAEAEATAIARDQRLTTNSALADQAIARIGNINGLGVVSPHFYHRSGAEQLRVSSQQNYPSAATVNGVYADPKTGEPLAVQGPAEPLAKSNTPNTHQQLNAPLTSREWVGSQIEQMSARDFPRADINASTALFSQRLAPVLQGLGVDTTNLSPNVRSLAEVDQAVDLVVRLSKQQGKKFYSRTPGPVPGTTKRVFVSNPGLESVLEAMHYSDVDKAQFANALYALTMQEQSSVNQEATRRYQSRSERAFDDGDITFGTPTYGKNVQGALINPRGKVATQLRKLDGRASGERLSDQELRDARAPRQGLAINPDGSTEQPRIDRRVPAGMTSTDDIAKEKRQRMEAYAAKSGKTVDEAALRKHTVGAQLAYLRQQRAEGKSTRPTTIWDEPASTRPPFPKNYTAGLSPLAGADPFGGGTVPPPVPVREPELEVQRTMRAPGQSFGQQGPQEPPTLSRPQATSQPEAPAKDRGVRNEIVRRRNRVRDMRATALGVGGGVMALAGINGLMNRDQGGL